MKEAKISEIFTSLQGEGIYMGVMQLFVRFYGCGLSCDFCDTKLSSYRTFTRDSLMSKILEQKKTYHSISLTGGEPLLYADFIKDFLHEYKKFYNKTIYLETNGTLHEELSQVIDYIDIVAMDFKLPTSTKGKEYWSEHEKFLKIARSKETFIKAVVTSETSCDDITHMGKIVEKVDRNIPIVLQPVSASGDSAEPAAQDLESFRDILKVLVKRVEVIPQVHKLIGVR